MEDHQFRVLLIDDDEDDYVLVRDLLSEVHSMSYDLNWASSYDDGLKSVCQSKYDVCLLDYRLGDRNGLDLLDVAASESTSPVIVLTGQSDYNVDMNAMRAGAADYLRKDELNAAILDRSIRYSIERKKAAQTVRASHRFLEIANRHMEMLPLLRECLGEVRHLTGCRAAGIRILDDKGNITYEVHEGFSEDCHELQSPLSLKSERNVCIDVTQGTTDPRLPFFTEGGSFYTNATSRLLATLCTEDKERMRSVCSRMGFESVALSPIRSGDRILGLIHLADYRAGMVPLETVQMIEVVALQLAAALQRIAADEALRESQRQLKFLSSKLLIVQEEERARIAQELHDVTGQTLVAIKYGIEGALGAKGTGEADAMAKSLEGLIPRVQKAIEQVKAMYMSLRPSILDDLGIVQAIGWLCREFSEANPDIVLKREVEVEEDKIPDSIRTVIFRLAQEALQNVAEHSKASAVNLSLAMSHEALELVIGDNGVGCDVRNIMSAVQPNRGIGFASMRERVELSDGKFFLEGVMGKGVTLRAIWPMKS